MKINEYTPEQFSELEQLWTPLERGKDMTVFQSYKWYKWLNTAYTKEKMKNYFRKWVYLVCFNDHNIPVMIAPIQIVRIGKSIKGVGLDRGAYFIGRKRYTDYMTFIYNQFNPDAVDCIMEYLKNQFRINRFYFEFVLENTEFSNYIIDKYRITGQKTYSSAALYLPETFDSYYSSLKKHAKQNLRTAINRQKRDELNLHHEIVFEIDNSLQQQLLEIRAQRLKDKQNKSVKKITSKLYNWAYKGINDLFGAKMNVFECLNDQWCFLVKHENRIVGFYWGIYEKDHYYVIYAGVDKEYTWYSPSLSHLYLWIQELYEDNPLGIKIIDFTVGDERYKTDIGGAVRKIQQLFFTD